MVGKAPACSQCLSLPCSCAYLAYCLMCCQMRQHIALPLCSCCGMHRAGHREGRWLTGLHSVHAQGSGSVVATASLALVRARPGLHAGDLTLRPGRADVAQERVRLGRRTSRAAAPDQDVTGTDCCTGVSHVPSMHLAFAAAFRGFQGFACLDLLHAFMIGS